MDNLFTETIKIESIEDINIAVEKILKSKYMMELDEKERLEFMACAFSNCKKGEKNG